MASSPGSRSRGSREVSYIHPDEVDMFDSSPPEPNSQEPATTAPARRSWLTTPNDEPPQEEFAFAAPPRGRFTFAAPPPRGSNVAFWSHRPPSFVPQHIPPHPGPATQIPTGCQPPDLCERPQPGLVETSILETHPSATTLRPQSQNFAAHQSPPVSHHESFQGRLHSCPQDSAPEQPQSYHHEESPSTTGHQAPPTLRPQTRSDQSTGVEDLPHLAQKRPPPPFPYHEYYPSKRSHLRYEVEWEELIPPDETASDSEPEGEEPRPHLPQTSGHHRHLTTQAVCPSTPAREDDEPPAQDLEASLPQTLGGSSVQLPAQSAPPRSGAAQRQDRGEHGASLPQSSGNAGPQDHDSSGPLPTLSLASTSFPEEDPRVREQLQSRSINVPIPPVQDCPEIRQQRPSEFDTNIRMEIMQGVVDAVNRFHALGKVERDLAGEEIEKLQGELRRNEGTLEIAYRELDKKNKLLAERHAQLTEQEEQLAEKDTVSRECMAQCNEWKEKALSALREKDTLLADIESLRSKLGESQKLTENMPAKLREYKAKLNEAIDEQQDLYHRSLAYCDSATDAIQQEKNARASSASEVVMALEANRNKQAELREGYRTVCEELQRDSERKDEHIRQLEADLTNQRAELAQEKQSSASLRSSIQENANIDQVMKLLQDQQQLFLSKFDAISMSLSENRIKASDLTTAGDKFKDTILASILPEFQSLHAQQGAINDTLEQEFEQEGVSLEDLSVQLEEFAKRAGEVQGLRESLVVALQDAVEKSDALRKSQDEVIAALRIQVDGVNGQVPVQQSVNTTLNQMAGPDGTSHSSRTLIGGADHDVGGPDSQPPYTPTPNPRDRKVIVSSPEKDSVSAGRPISVAEEQSRRRDASAPRPRSALRTYAGVTKPANSQRVSPSAPFTSWDEYERRRRNGNN
ncbi:hypothetical protein FSOLCH5_004120 [Fusarium solani]|nr:hypothetical protein NW759_001359 [Fusarium solani]